MELQKLKQQQQQPNNVLPLFSKEDVARHSSMDSAWLVYNGFVYDVTEYLAEHPGGSLVILENGVKLDDATENFDAIHTPEQLLQLEQYRIGKLLTTDTNDEREDDKGDSSSSSASEMRRIYHRGHADEGSCKFKDLRKHSSQEPSIVPPFSRKNNASPESDIEITESSRSILDPNQSSDKEFGSTTTNQSSPPIVVGWYASENGFTAGLASTFSHELKEWGCIGTMNALSQCENLSCVKDLGTPGATLLVVLTSTAGTGEIPLAARSWFSRFKEFDGQPFKGLPFAIFGIGDSNHLNFNSAAKQIGSALKRAGAHSISCRFGDRANKINEFQLEFTSWCNDVREFLSRVENGPIPGGPMRLPLVTGFRWGIVSNLDRRSAEEKRRKMQVKRRNSVRTQLSENSQIATVTSVKVLCQRMDSLQGKKKVELTMKLNRVFRPPQLFDEKHHFVDLHVHPINSHANVESFASILRDSTENGKINLDSPFYLVPSSGFGDYDLPYPNPTNLRHILRTKIDLTGPPNQLMFRRLLILLANTKNLKNQNIIPSFRLDREGNKIVFPPQAVNDTIDGTNGNRNYRNMLVELHALSQPQNKSLWKSMFQREQGFSLLTIFKEYTLIREIPLPDLLQMFGEFCRLATRPYSVVSLNQSGDGLSVKILVSVLHSSSFPGGLCSNYLANLAKGSTILVTMKRSSIMTLPSNLKVPIVMIAAGTGIAPFINLLEKRNQTSSEKLGPALLFFGCKREDYDFLYKDKLKSLTKTGSLMKLIPVFSKANSDDRSRKRLRYVQDVLVENSSLVKEHLLSKSKGVLYICGSSGMGKGVCDVLTKYLGKDEVKTMEFEHRIMVDTWGEVGEGEIQDKTDTWVLPDQRQSLRGIGKSLKKSVDDLIKNGRLPDMVFHDMLNMTNFEVGVPTKAHLVKLAELADADGSLSQILRLLPGPCNPSNSDWIGEGDNARCDPVQVAQIARQVQVEFFQGNEMNLIQVWQSKFSEKGLVANIVYPRFTVYGCGSTIQHKIIPRVLLGDHTDNEAVMRQHVQKDPFNEIQTFENIANTPDNALWRHQRNVLVCPFQPDVMRVILPQSLNRARYMITRLYERVGCGKLLLNKKEKDDQVGDDKTLSATIDMNDFLVDESLAHLLEVMLGIPRDEANPLNETIRLAFAVEKYLQQPEYLEKVKKPMLGPALKKIMEALPRLDGPLARALKLSDKQLSEHSINKKAVCPHVQLGNLMNVLHAGHTNVGYTLAFLLLELTRNPIIQIQLKNAIQSWWTELDNDFEVTLEDLHSERLDILDRCITEILRLWPTVATGSFRTLEFDHEVSNGCVSSMSKLPKGTSVNTPIWHRHRDTNLWGKDANCFCPLSRNFEANEISRITRAFPSSKRFAPFGYSPRSCPAAQYSGLQMRVIVLHLFKEFHFELASPYKEAVGPGMNILTCPPNADPSMFRGVVRGAMGPLDLERKISHSWGTQYLAGLRCHAIPDQAKNQHQSPGNMVKDASPRFVCKPHHCLLRTSPEESSKYKDYIEPKTIPQQFFLKVQSPHHRNLIALREVDLSGNRSSARQWTWSEYNVEVEKVARALIQLGIAQQTPVAILGKNSPEWYFAAMGSIFASQIAFGIYTSSLPGSVEYILNHSKASIMFVDSISQEEKVLKISKNLKYLRFVVSWDCGTTLFHKYGKDNSLQRMSWEAFVQCQTKDLCDKLDSRINNQNPGQCCYLSYTSGTTGKPKAVMHSHDSLLWGMGRLLMHCKTQEDFDKNAIHDSFPQERRELSFLPCCHVAGTLQIVGPVVDSLESNTIIHFAVQSLGAPLADHATFVSLLKEIGPTSFWCVPRIWQKLQLTMMFQSNPKLSDIGLGKCRFATTGSAPTRPDIFSFFRSNGLNLCECYAMTENAMYSHLAISGNKKQALSDEGSQVRFSSKNNEILLKSRALMMGYLHMPKESNDAFSTDGFFHTGDVGQCSFETSGFLEITGRIKDLIITSGGENVASTPIEEAVRRELPAISNAVLVGDGQKYLIVLLTIKVLEEGHLLGKPGQLIDAESRTVADAQRSSLWSDYIEQGIKRANSIASSRVAQIKRWVLLNPDGTGDFSSFGYKPELTPTGKVKRNVVLEKYAKDIQACYKEKEVKDIQSKVVNETGPIVVIGGGIGGLYYAYRKMRLQSESQPIHIYEASNRLGGKFQTSFSHGLHAELGPLRFEWGIQPVMETLINELEIPLDDFPPFCGDGINPDIAFIRRICGILWGIRQTFNKSNHMESSHISNTKKPEVEHITAEEIEALNDRAWLPYKGGYVYPHEIWINEWLADFNPDLEKELFIVYSRIRAFLIPNDTLLLWLVRWTKVLVANHSIRQCKRGNQSLIDALEEKLPKDSIHLEHKLVKIEAVCASGKDKMYRCVFDNGISVRTNRIILAVPPTVLQKLEFPKRKEVDLMLANLRGYCLGRHFIYVENPPWSTRERDKAKDSPLAYRSTAVGNTMPTDDSSRTSVTTQDQSLPSQINERYEQKSGRRRMMRRGSELQKKILASDFQCRETYVSDTTNSSGKSIGLLMLYFNGENVRFWRGKSPQEQIRFVQEKLGMDFVSPVSAVRKTTGSLSSCWHALWKGRRHTKKKKSESNKRPTILDMKSVFWDGRDEDTPFAFHFLDRTDPYTAREVMATASTEADLSISSVADAFSIVPGFSEGVLLNVDYIIEREMAHEKQHQQEKEYVVNCA